MSTPLSEQIANLIAEETGVDGRDEAQVEALNELMARVMGIVDPALDSRVEMGARACLAELVASKTLITEEHMLGVFYRGRLSGGQRETRELLAAVKSRVVALD